MKERKLNLPKIVITPINPFTPRQAQIVELRANGFNHGQIALILGISRLTVSKFVKGERSIGSRSECGILGNIENANNKMNKEKNRPPPHDWVQTLMGDVLFFEDNSLNEHLQKHPINFEKEEKLPSLL